MTEINLKEMHHAYIGLLIIIISFFFDGWIKWTLLIAGYTILADDVEQEITKIYIPEFRSPMNILFRYLWGLTGWTWPFKF